MKNQRYNLLIVSRIYELLPQSLYPNFIAAVLIYLVAGFMEIKALEVVTLSLSYLTGGSSKDALLTTYEFFGTSYLGPLLILSLAMISRLMSLRMSYYFGARVGEKLSIKLFDKFRSLEYSSYLKLGKAKFLSCCLEELNSLIGAINALMLAISNIITIFFLVFLISNQVDLGSLASGVIGAFIVISSISRLIYPTIDNAAKSVLKYTSERMNILDETYNMYRYIKLYNVSPYLKESISSIERIIRRETAKKSVLINSLSPFISTTIYIFLLFFALYTTTFGASTKITSTVVLLGVILQRLIPIINNINAQINTMRGKGSFVLSIYNFLKLNIDKRSVINRNHQSMYTSKHEIGSIYIHNVSFGYDQKKSLFSSLSIEIKKGNSLCIVGESGSGKSTLLDLMTGFIYPKEGYVGYCKDNDAIVTTDNVIYKQFVSYVPQSSYIFNKSLIENIALHRLNQCEVDIKEILHASFLDGFVKELSEGIHSPLGTGGVELSGGQKQRVSIARALYEKRPILIMDEPTSALDQSTSIQLMKRLKDYCSKNSISLIIVTHDKELSALFECVLSLD